jgi:hypothetical protein
MSTELARYIRFRGYAAFGRQQHSAVYVGGYAGLYNPGNGRDIGVWDWACPW